MEDNEGTLKKTIHGGKWMFLNTIFQQAVAIASFPILARLLLPEYFGIMSLLFVVPNLLNLITLIGFEFTLIQSKEDPKKYLNEIWTLSILRTMVIFIIIFFSAPLIAKFFHLEKAVWAIRLSGIFLVIAGFSNVAKLYFFKNIDFKKVFIRDALSSVFYAVISISLAIFYKSFWPLFFGYIGQYLSDAISTYFLHEYRPRLSFKFKKLKELIGYSKWIFGQNLVINAMPMIESGLIGRIIDATGVGLYTRAKSIASLPSAPLYNIFETVTYPAYAKIQDSYEKIRDGLVKSLDLLFFLAMPFILLFWEAGHRLILIFLGEKWIGMDALLKILLLAATITTLNVLSGPIFNAVGKPKIQFYINIVNIVALVSLFLLLVPLYGSIGAAIAFLISSVIVFLISFLKLVKILDIKIIKIIKLLLIPLASSLIIFSAGKAILALFGNMGDIPFLALVACLGIFYLALIALFGKFLKAGPYVTLKLIFLEIFKRPKNALAPQTKSVI